MGACKNIFLYEFPQIFGPRKRTYVCVCVCVYVCVCIYACLGVYVFGISVYKRPNNINTQIRDNIQCLQMWFFYFIQSDPHTLLQGNT